MKKLPLLLTFFIFFSGYSQTTLEEYNYMTKGYRIQLESGLDTKKGYQVQDLLKISKNDYSFDFKTLTREADDELAGIMVLAYSKVWDNRYYLAIPIKNNDLYQRFEDDVERWDKKMTMAYAIAVSEMLMVTTFALTDQ